MLYTYLQPVRAGFYYIVVKAKNDEEATDHALQVASTFEHAAGDLVALSSFPEDTLVLDPKMKARLDEFGVAHLFTSTPYPQFHERKGYRGFLP